ncbi:Cbb3-type cytochrome c oxidase subunit [Pseudovibrio japonicus]|uniref:Cbb3-type cytochrome c oxidase subunit n=1 Tax=Pseudovibrio japonicus TaxID=366534 RepID=A0ABQ3EMZ1_9HYPH|nr:cytochrome-c oxidase, cbb3-type subunit III [Pseudovibrio japonicus]GHB42277.1 Cbb3-type cytochrome c oxidase subunit [Pseudovibrio japonicus]
MQIEHDEVSGQKTTGHEWDGIKELDTPVPKWAKWAYIITSLVALGGWILYPAIPLGSDFTRGLFGTTSRANVLEAVKEAEVVREKDEADLIDGDLYDLVDDPTIRAKYESAARVLFTDNCAACHGRDLKGQTGFPNLVDDSWLFGDDLDEIEWTIRYGINANNDDTRYSEMPAFGRDEMLEQADIKNVAEYVLSLSGAEHDATLAKAGSEVFENECSACHGETGEGVGIGAPNLTDSFWIYGGTRKDILETLENGRAGHMPSWDKRLKDADIKKLVLYLNWSKDNGED